MKLVVDESVDHQIVKRLRDDGHDVLYIAELAPSVSDETVLQQANENKALLLTQDKDFGELAFRQKFVHHGVVLIRISGLSNQTKADLVADVFRERASALVNAFSVISPGMIRIRPHL